MRRAAFGAEFRSECFWHGIDLRGCKIEFGKGAALPVGRDGLGMRRDQVQQELSDLLLRVWLRSHGGDTGSGKIEFVLGHCPPFREFGRLSRRRA